VAVARTDSEERKKERERERQSVKERREE